MQNIHLASMKFGDIACKVTCNGPTTTRITITLASRASRLVIVSNSVLIRPQGFLVFLFCINENIIKGIVARRVTMPYHSIVERYK